MCVILCLFSLADDTDCWGETVLVMYSHMNTVVSLSQYKAQQCALQWQAVKLLMAQGWSSTFTFCSSYRCLFFLNKILSQILTESILAWVLKYYKVENYSLFPFDLKKQKRYRSKGGLTVVLNSLYPVAPQCCFSLPCETDKLWFTQ